MPHEDHSVTLREIAGQLQAAADALETMAGRCGCPSGSQVRGDVHERGCPMRRAAIEYHWSLHFLSDAKSMKLLAEAREVLA